ncbi:DNA repair protein XRCC4 [Phasianus colchicus]|uniref:DNA repair protein XRCC4 n=1 Tax=Phasianus colchicus TaxID=9054 RepID=UPI00129E431F|nr:DNA repair protein XRCC4 [Phasianus colchicus]
MATHSRPHHTSGGCGGKCRRPSGTGRGGADRSHWWRMPREGGTKGQRASLIGCRSTARRPGRAGGSGARRRRGGTEGGDWKMEKTLIRIHPVSDPEAEYFLQVSWEKDISSGFGIILTDGEYAWTGTVSEAEISREAADMEMNREKYVEELKKALIFGEESAGKYNFTVSVDEENAQCHFSYERNLKDGSVSMIKCLNLTLNYEKNLVGEMRFRLGSLKLQKVSHPADVVKELIGYCLDCLGGLQVKNEHLQKENERLFCDLSDVEKRLEKCVEAKEELEADLYNRFVLVLNEKKTKIRNLQKLLNEAKELAVDTQCTRDSIATTQMATEKEDDYDGSTEEESENLIQSSLPSAPERRDSLLGSPDVISTAPRRKRRQRTMNPAGTEAKIATYETEMLAKEKTDLSSQKTAGKHSPDVMSLETLENTCEPEDLFDDI